MENKSKEPLLDAPTSTMLFGALVSVVSFIGYINSSDELTVPEQKDSSNKQLAFLGILSGLAITYIGYKNAHKKK